MAYSGFDLTGRTAVVVGGTSGIGRALVESACESGCRVEVDAIEGAEGFFEALGFHHLGEGEPVANGRSARMVRPASKGS